MKKSLKTALGFALLMPTLLLCSSCSEEYGTKGTTETLNCTVERPGLTVKVDKDWFEAKEGMIDTFTVNITTTPNDRCHDFDIESMTVRLNLSNAQVLYTDINPDEMGKCNVTFTQEIIPLENFHVWVGIESIKGTYVRDVPAQGEEKDGLVETLFPTDYWMTDKYGYYKVYPKYKTAKFMADKSEIDRMKWFGFGSRYQENLYIPDYATCKNGSKLKTIVDSLDYDYGYGIYDNVQTLMLDGTFDMLRIAHFVGSRQTNFPSLKTLYIKELVYSKSDDVTNWNSVLLDENVTVYIDFQDQDCSDRFGKAKVITGNDVDFKITKAMKENKKNILVYVTPITIIVDGLILIVALVLLSWIIMGFVEGIKAKR